MFVSYLLDLFSLGLGLGLGLGLDRNKQIELEKSRPRPKIESDYIIVQYPIRQIALLKKHIEFEDDVKTSYIEPINYKEQNRKDRSLKLKNKKYKKN